MPRVIHFEIHAANPDALIRFYTEMFGWSFQAFGPPGMYWLVRTGDPKQPGIDGGLLPRRGDSPADGQPVNAYVCTVGVDSAEDALERLQALGGTVAHPVMPIPGVGWLAYGKDPDGNIVGMMQEDPSAQ